MQDYAEKYATETNFKTIMNSGEETHIPRVHSLIEKRGTRSKPKAMLSQFDLMIDGMSQKKDYDTGDTPSCIDMNTVEECSMFITSTTKFVDLNEVYKNRGKR